MLNIQDQRGSPTHDSSQPFSPASDAGNARLLSQTASADTDHMLRIQHRAKMLLRGTQQFNPSKMEFGQQLAEDRKPIRPGHMVSKYRQGAVENHEFLPKTLRTAKPSVSYNQNDAMKMPSLKGKTYTSRYRPSFPKSTKPMAPPSLNFRTVTEADRSPKQFTGIDTTENFFSQRSKQSEQVGITGVKFNHQLEEQRRRLQMKKLLPVHLKLPKWMMTQSIDQGTMNSDFHGQSRGLLDEDPDDVIMRIGDVKKQWRHANKQRQEKQQESYNHSNMFQTRQSAQPLLNPRHHGHQLSSQPSASGERNIFSAVPSQPFNQTNILLVQYSQASDSVNVHDATEAERSSFREPLETMNNDFGLPSLMEQSRIETKDQARYIRRFDELTQETLLQNVFIKIWKLIVKIQYGGIFSAEAKLLKQTRTDHKQQHKFLLESSRTNGSQAESSFGNEATFESQIPTLPLDISLYRACLPQIKKVLGAMFESDDFTAQKPQYCKNNIFFDRFCFDMVSLIGNNVFKLSLTDIEYIFRVSYLTLSHSFGPSRGGVRLLELGSIIKSPFSLQEFQNMDKKLNKQSIEVKNANRRRKPERRITQEFTEPPLSGASSSVGAITKAPSTSKGRNREQPKAILSQEFEHQQLRNYARGKSPNGKDDMSNMDDMKPFTSRTDQHVVMSDNTHSLRQHNDTYLLSNNSEAKVSPSNVSPLSQPKLKPIDNLLVQSKKSFKPNEHPWSQDDQLQPQSCQIGSQEPGAIINSESVQEALVVTKQRTVSQMIEEKYKKARERADTKKCKVEKIREMEQLARSYQPRVVYTKEIDEKYKQNYQSLIGIKQKKRINPNPALNGIDLSKYSLLNNNVNKYAQSRDGEFRQNSQDLEDSEYRAASFDILDSFQHYDESHFKYGVQDQIREQFEQELSSVEYSLLASNRIERKTILLNQMQAVDQGSQGRADSGTMSQKQEDLVLRLGTKNILGMSTIDNHQRSLDQYDALNSERKSRDSQDQGLVELVTSRQRLSKVEIAPPNPAPSHEQSQEPVSAKDPPLARRNQKSKEPAHGFKVRDQMDGSNTEITCPLASEKSGTENQTQLHSENNKELSPKPQSPGGQGTIMMDQSEVNLEEGLVSRSQKQIEGNNQMIQRDSKSIVSKSHSKKEVMNLRKGTVFMSADSLDSQQEGASIPEVNSSKDEVGMGHPSYAQDTQAWQEQKQPRKKKTTPKHKLDSKGYALKKSNNDIKHLSSQGELDAAGEYFTQGCTPTNAAVIPMFTANQISAKIHPRRVENMPRKLTDDDKAQDMKDQATVISRSDPKAHMNLAFEGMNKSNYQKMISKHKNSSVGGAKQAAALGLAGAAAYGTRLDQQVHLKQLILDAQLKNPSRQREIVASMVFPADTVIVGPSPFSVRGDSMLNDGNSSSILRHIASQGTSRSPKAFDSIQASILTFPNQTQFKNLKAGVQITIQNQQREHIPESNKSAANQNVQTGTNQRVHDVQYYASTDKSIASWHQPQESAFVEDEAGLAIAKKKSGAVKQTETRRPRGRELDLSAAVQQRQIFAKKYSIERATKRDSVYAGALQQDSIMQNMERDHPDQPNGAKDQESQVDQEVELKEDQIASSAKQSVNQMSIEIPNAEQLPSLPISESSSPLFKQKSQDATTGVSPKAKSRYQIINKKSPAAKQREKEMHVTLNIVHEREGRSQGSWRRGPDTTIKKIFRVQRLQNYDEQPREQPLPPAQFNLVIETQPSGRETAGKLATLASPSIQEEGGPDTSSRGGEQAQEMGGKFMLNQQSKSFTLKRPNSKSPEEDKYNEDRTLRLDGDQENGKRSPCSLTQMSKYENKATKPKNLAQSIVVGPYTDSNDLDLGRLGRKNRANNASLKQIQLKDMPLRDEESMIVVAESPSREPADAESQLRSPTVTGMQSQQYNEPQAATPLKVSLETKSREGQAVSGRHQFVSFDNSRDLLPALPSKRSADEHGPSVHGMAASVHSSLVYRDLKRMKEYLGTQNLTPLQQHIHPLGVQAQMSHMANKRCRRICCIQNALTNQLHVHEKVSKIRNSKYPSPSKGIANIAVVKLDDYNMQSWRETSGH